MAFLYNKKIYKKINIKTYMSFKTKQYLINL